MTQPAEARTADAQAWGLCASCAHARVIASDRGSRFVQCGRARTDPRFPRYPVVPVRSCPGFDDAGGGGDDAQDRIRPDP